MGNEIVAWIANIFGDETGKIIGVIFISMLPIIELRGAIPVAFALGLNWWTAAICAFIGNMIPIPFILLFVEQVFKFMKKRNILTGFVEKMEKKAESKKGEVEKYKFWGLAIFVGIPLPGTGGWTGSLIASVIKMDKKSAFLSVLIGVVIALVIVTAATYGLIGYFF